MQQMGIAEAEDYLAFVLAAYDLASTDAEKSESRNERNETELDMYGRVG